MTVQGEHLHCGHLQGSGQEFDKNHQIKIEILYFIKQSQCRICFIQIDYAGIPGLVCLVGWVRFRCFYG